MAKFHVTVEFILDEEDMDVTSSAEQHVRDILNGDYDVYNLTDGATITAVTIPD